jgi:translation initiation factor IF-1
MVRNEGGGNKMKHMARKHVNGTSQSSSKLLRISESPDEKYAYVVRILGNSMCMVKCINGYELLCHIRGKFTGRSKRENAISSGTWVLIGLRQWDADKEFASKKTKTGKSIQKCDLLEIYTPSEREKLRVQEKIFQDIAIEHEDDRDSEFKLSKQAVEFKDQATLEYQEIIEQGGNLSRMKKTSYTDLYNNISDSDSGDSDSGDSDSGDSDHDSDHDSDSTAASTAASTHQSTIVPDLPRTPPQTSKNNKHYYQEDVNIDDI